VQKKNAKNFGLRSGLVGGAANRPSTRGRCPATAHRGDFWLLGFPPGPVRLSLAKPGARGLPRRTHVDDKLSADVRSTRSVPPQLPPPQTIHAIRPPCSRITGARRRSRSDVCWKVLLFKCRNRVAILY